MNIYLGENLDSFKYRLTYPEKFYAEVLNNTPAFHVMTYDLAEAISQKIAPDNITLSLYFDVKERKLQVVDFYLGFSEELHGKMIPLVDLMKTITRYAAYIPILKQVDTTCQTNKYYRLKDYCGIYELGCTPNGCSLKIQFEAE